MSFSFWGRLPAWDLIIDPTVGCHCFLLGPQLPSQLQSITALRGTNLYCVVIGGTYINYFARVTAWQQNCHVVMWNCVHGTCSAYIVNMINCLSHGSLYVCTVWLIVLDLTTLICSFYGTCFVCGLLHDAMLARYMLWFCVHPTVSPSQISVLSKQNLCAVLNGGIFSDVN